MIHTRELLSTKKKRIGWGAIAFSHFFACSLCCFKTGLEMSMDGVRYGTIPLLLALFIVKQMKNTVLIQSGKRPYLNVGQVVPMWH